MPVSHIIGCYSGFPEPVQQRRAYSAFCYTNSQLIKANPEISPSLRQTVQFCVIYPASFERLIDEASKRRPFDLSIRFAAPSGNVPLRPGPFRQSATPLLESLLEPLGLADSRLGSASTAKRAGATAGGGTGGSDPAEASANPGRAESGPRNRRATRDRHCRPSTASSANRGELPATGIQ